MNPHENIDTPLCETLSALKHSPLAQLSLSSRELFHSNFLAWFCESCGAMASGLFGDFLSKQPTGGIRTVERERKNIDLWLHFEDGQELIVENKVKSLPDAGQLDEYAAKVGTEGSSFLLLCMERPSFIRSSEEFHESPGGRRWKVLTYEELAWRLKSILDSDHESSPVDTYHRMLVEDYISFILNLSGLFKHFRIEADVDDCFFDGSERIGKLDVGRLASGIVKMRYSQLAGMLEETLRGLGFETVSDPAAYWKSEGNEVLVWAGMTRSVGLLDFKFPLVASGRNAKLTPVTLGVQLQGSSFRLSVECMRQDASSVAKLLLDHGGNEPGWFDFGLLNLPSKEKEFPANRSFNRFGSGFLYRSKNLERGIKSSEIVRAIVAYAEFARNNKEALLKRLESSVAST